MGPPGVGKGTQAGRLKRALGVPHVSTGEILRAAVAQGSTLGQQAKRYVDSGRLVPDALMGEIIGARLAQPDAAEGFILDGFPRTVEQVQILDRVLGQLGTPVDHVFAGPMADETIHFVEAVVYGRPVMVKPDEARLVMDVYTAADLSDELGEPVTLPRNDPSAAMAAK